MCQRIIALLVVLPCVAAWVLPATAQQAMESVTKTITRDIQLSDGDAFRVVVEKANVKIAGWDKAHIQARIVFTASHPDKKVAALEFGYMQYAISRESNLVEFINAFVLPANIDVIHSKMDVLLEFMVPAGIALKLEARYGNVTLSDVTGDTDADIEFSDLDLDRVGGSFMLRANFSEIRGEAVRVSSFKSQDARSQFSMDVAGGSYSFQSKYSKLDLAISAIKGLHVNAARTDVMVRTESVSAYRYDLASASGKLHIPGVYEEAVRRSGDREITMRTPADESKPLIQIKTTFDTITIK